MCLRCSAFGQTRCGRVLKQANLGMEGIESNEGELILAESVQHVIVKYWSGNYVQVG